MSNIRYNTPHVHYHFGNSKVLRAVLPANNDKPQNLIIHVLPHDIGEGVETCTEEYREYPYNGYNASGVHYTEEYGAEHCQ